MNDLCLVDALAGGAKFSSVSTVAELEAALPGLTLAEREGITPCWHDLDDEDWDRQMARDAEPGGKLYRLMEEAEVEAEEGNGRDFPGREQE